MPEVTDYEFIRYNNRKFSQLWKVQRGFRIIRMNLRTMEIERQVKRYAEGLSWTPITRSFKNKREMEAAFNEMLRDDFTITEDCKETYFN